MITKTIAGKLASMFNWFVPIAGIDPSGNPQLIKVLADGSLDVTASYTADSKELVPAISVVSASGTVAAGKRAVSFIPSSDFTGTLLGAAWPLTNAAVGIEAGDNDTLGAVAYTRTTGSLTIITLSLP